MCLKPAGAGAEEPNRNSQGHKNEDARRRRRFQFIFLFFSTVEKSSVAHTDTSSSKILNKIRERERGEMEENY